MVAHVEDAPALLVAHECVRPLLPEAVDEKLDRARDGERR